MTHSLVLGDRISEYAFPTRFWNHPTFYPWSTIVWILHPRMVWELVLQARISIILLLIGKPTYHPLLVLLHWPHRGWQKGILKTPGSRIRPWLKWRFEFAQRDMTISSMNKTPFHLNLDSMFKIMTRLFLHYWFFTTLVCSQKRNNKKMFYFFLQRYVAQRRVTTPQEEQNYPSNCLFHLNLDLVYQRKETEITTVLFPIVIFAQKKKK